MARRTPTKPIAVSVRFTEDEYQQICTNRVFTEETDSQLIRRLLRQAMNQNSNTIDVVPSVVVTEDLIPA